MLKTELLQQIGRYHQTKSWWRRYLPWPKNWWPSVTKPMASLIRFTRGLPVKGSLSSEQSQVLRSIVSKKVSGVSAAIFKDIHSSISISPDVNKKNQSPLTVVTPTVQQSYNIQPGSANSITSRVSPVSSQSSIIEQLKADMQPDMDADRCADDTSNRLASVNIINRQHLTKVNFVNATVDGSSGRHEKAIPDDLASPKIIQRANSLVSRHQRNVIVQPIRSTFVLTSNQLDSQLQPSVIHKMPVRGAASSPALGACYVNRRNLQTAFMFGSFMATAEFVTSMNEGYFFQSVPKALVTGLIYGSSSYLMQHNPKSSAVLGGALSLGYAVVSFDYSAASLFGLLSFSPRAVLGRGLFALGMQTLTNRIISVTEPTPAVAPRIDRSIGR